MKSSESKYKQAQVDNNIGKIRVLMYHHVVSTGDLKTHSSMFIRADAFRRQLEYLDRWDYTTITFKDVKLVLEGELILPGKPVIITFDDGYSDVYETAFPILQEFGMKAVIFVIGDHSIKENIWDKGEEALKPLLNQQQILEMSAVGFEIGAHSMTHPNLTMASEKTATEEILRSRILLEILLNGSTCSFAYPYGLVNDTVKNIAKDAGYTIACGAFSGPAIFGEDLFEVRRILVPDTMNRMRFWWLLQPVYLYAHWVNWKLKKIFSKKRRTKTSYGKVLDGYYIKGKKEHVEPPR